MDGLIVNTEALTASRQLPRQRNPEMTFRYSHGNGRIAIFQHINGF
jgi:hypothetical protein